MFKQFGQHTIDLELWSYLPSRDERAQASDELHTTIDKAFREAGIEIARPQRDINIRTETTADWLRGRGETPPTAPVEP